MKSGNSFESQVVSAVTPAACQFVPLLEKKKIITTSRSQSRLFSSQFQPYFYQVMQSYSIFRAFLCIPKVSKSPPLTATRLKPANQVFPFSFAPAFGTAWGTHLLSIWSQGRDVSLLPTTSFILLYQPFFGSSFFSTEYSRLKSGLGRALKTKELSWNKVLQQNAIKMRNCMSRSQSNLFLSQKSVYEK